MDTCTMRKTLLSLATLLTVAAGQDTNADLIFNNSQIQVQSTDQYSGSSLVGWHVGAGLSYMVADSLDSGNSFVYNNSATSAQLLDNDIAQGYALPCYVVVSDQISDNAGPLECGAGDQPGDYDVASLSEVDGATGATITFNGIAQWYVCAVQTFTYGWYQDTVVGSFGSGEPSGPGIQNCTSIDSLILVDGSSTSSSNATTTSTSTSTTSEAGTSPTVTSTPVTVTGRPCSSCTAITTVITSCANSTVASATHQVQSTIAAPVATFTGGASTARTSLVAVLSLISLVLLL